MHEPAVIYRRSNHSVTFRCQACHLQWTITLASLHHAASTFAAGFREAGVADDDFRVKQCDFIARGTKFAIEREAARKSTITRQKRTGKGSEQWNQHPVVIDYMPWPKELQ